MTKREFIKKMNKAKASGIWNNECRNFVCWALEDESVKSLFVELFKPRPRMFEGLAFLSLKLDGVTYELDFKKRKESRLNALALFEQIVLQEELYIWL